MTQNPEHVLWGLSHPALSAVEDRKWHGFGEDQIKIWFQQNSCFQNIARLICCSKAWHPSVYYHLAWMYPIKALSQVLKTCLLMHLKLTGLLSLCSEQEKADDHGCKYEQRKKSAPKGSQRSLSVAVSRHSFLQTILITQIDLHSLSPHHIPNRDHQWKKCILGLEHIYFYKGLCGRAEELNSLLKTSPRIEATQMHVHQETADFTNIA